MKAKEFKLCVSGAYRGRAYRYEEQVPAADYQLHGWRLKSVPGVKKAIIEQLNNAQAGDHFVWEEDGCRTEVWAL